MKANYKTISNTKESAILMTYGLKNGRRGYCTAAVIYPNCAAQKIEALNFKDEGFVSFELAYCERRIIDSFWCSVLTEERIF